MARHAIIDKLDRELQEPIASERQVVYILVEIRKLMERNNDTDKYFALNFYCDWAMHTKLDRLGAGRIVERFNKYQELIELTQCTPDGTVPQADLQFLAQLEDTLRLRKFRQQFGEYLKGNDLPDDIARDDGAWTNFLSYYFHVIEDCPLVCNAPLDHVREVSISVIETKSGVDAQMAGYSVMFAWEWQPLQSPIFTRRVSMF
jgi:hypothetical protein